MKGGIMEILIALVVGAAITAYYNKRRNENKCRDCEWSAKCRNLISELYEKKIIGDRKRHWEEDE